MQPAETLIRPFNGADLAPVPVGWRTGAPDFVGIGSGKAGSSWWHHLLSQHPHVVPNRLGLKEVHYFPHLGWTPPDEAAISLYRSAFARPPGHRCGEWSANYLYVPFALEALAQAAPHTKLIVTLRNPVDRLASLLNQYTAFRAKLIGAQGDGEAILRRWSLFPEAAYQACVADGLQRLYDLFPREQVHVVQYECAAANPEVELAKTLRFLDLDADWTPPNPRRPVHRQPYVIDKPSAAEREHIARWFQRDVERTLALVPELDVRLWAEFAPVPVGA